MPVWKPEAKWAGQDVFIIGGGNSLRERHFDWNLLKPELTIGCNTAFLLGPEVCKICVGGDRRWFEHFEDDLEKFKGVVFTNHSSLRNSKKPWLWWIGRESVGLHTTSLGWNGNTGAVAINLALVLGASRIFLLGFDMKIVAGKSNWHDHILDKTAVRPEVYPKFCEEFRHVYKDWKAKFADREIINVTDDSNLEWFPKVPFDAFWKERIKRWDAMELKKAGR